MNDPFDFTDLTPTDADIAAAMTKRDSTKRSPMWTAHRTLRLLRTTADQPHLD